MNNGVAMSMSTKSIGTETSSETNGLVKKTTTRQKASNSKFAGLMAAEVSSPSHGFEPLAWQGDDDGMNSNNGGIVRTAILCDDELTSSPSNNEINNNDIQAPSLHNKRTLYYHPSLLTIDEATSLQNAAERSGKFQEFDSRCAVIVEDGVYQNDFADSTSNRGASLTSLLHPILTSKIIPWARQVTSIPTLTIADALIRSYDPSEERQDLSPHYDISTFATVIVPLNDPNDYEGGLYVQTGASTSTRLGVPFTKAGDAVLHRYDVMHGVNVRSGKKRCSLVIWFGENEESVATKTVPWVMREANIGTSVHAAFLYGFNSQNGLYGFEKDLEVAKRYYGWASQRGHALSAYQLSFILFKEWCSTTLEESRGDDLQNESVTLLALAAERGDVSAQHELGIMYKQGYRGLERDVEIARYWLELAAEQGHRLSKEMLDDPSRWRVWVD